MWFKNLRIYRLTQPLDSSAEQLEQQLLEKPFSPCSGLEKERQGWQPPLGRHGQLLVHTVGNYHMLCAKRQEKILPASVLKEAVDEKAEQIAQEEGRRMSRRERIEFKEELEATLLPRAFTRSRLTYGLLLPKSDWLLIDTSSTNRAEDWLKLLRECTTRLPAVPLMPKQPATRVMTQWLLDGDVPAPFALTEECELRHPQEEGGVVSCKNQDLTSDEIRSHLDAGKRVSRIGLSWNDRIRFVIDDQLAIKRIRFDDELVDQATEGAEDAAQHMDQDLAIMAPELEKLLADIVDLFGGWQAEAAL